MKNFIRKTFSIFFVLVLSMLVLVACGSKIKLEDLESLVFESTSFVYDGEEHSITIDNIYEEQGVAIEYKNNVAKLPGEYQATATITFEELKVEKEATLTITKKQSTLSAEKDQKAYYTDSEIKINYTLDNNQQKLVYLLNGKEIKLSELTKVGKYELEVYAKENSFYLESNHVQISLEIVQSMYGVQFNSTTVIADGTEKKLELTGELPTGFTVEYANNKGTEDGSYFATATIKNASGEVVETHYAVLKVENPENEEFNKYLDEFFVEYLEEDQLSVNIFCENPEKFGLSHYDAEWYTYEEFGDEEIASDLESFKEYLAELEEFKDAKLNDLQESAYRTIEKFFKENIEYLNIKDAPYTNIVYVDQFGGYVADFGTYMEAYSLRSEQEIKDIVSYVESTKTAFPSYVEFVRVKAEKGYALSDFTIKEMRTYLEDVLEQGENYYLKDIICNNIDAVEFLNDTQKQDYKNKVAEAFKNNFVPGVQALYDGLEKYLGKLDLTKTGYMASYEQGKELYVNKLKGLLGVEELDMEKYIAEIDKAAETAVNSVISTQELIFTTFRITSYAGFLQALERNAIVNDTPENMVTYLKEFAKTIVPELQSNPDIKIKEMDEASAKVSNAVAYYMKSALDNTGSENITLNPVTLLTSDKNDVLGTLAHEGYPGHLYAYVYSKELGLSNIATIMTSTAHGEGWAKYVETKLYDYAKEQSTDNKFKLIMNYLKANALSGHLLETRIDVGIFYEGWTASDIATYMSDLGYDSSSAQEIYNLIIEMPTTYAAYGYGRLEFSKLHDEAQKVLGKYYDEVEFNAMLLSKGWVGFDILEDTYEEYMKAKCFELGIEYK